MRLKRQQNELWLTTSKPSGPVEQNEDEPEPAKEPEWSRWVLHDTRQEKEGVAVSVSLMPAFPDRPLIVQPEYPMRLGPNAEIIIFVRIPVFISVKDETPKTPRFLTDIPTVSLSNTWFGSMTEGELCYWLKTRARPFPEMEKRDPHLCTSPVHIVNSSDEELLVDKLCLRLDTLRIFDADGQLWSDQMNIIYKGEEKFSDLNSSGKPPQQAPHARLLSPPRKASTSNIAMRTFKALNQLHPFSVFS